MRTELTESETSRKWNPGEVIGICRSQWDKIVPALEGRLVTRYSIGAVLGGLSLDATPALHDIPLSDVLKLDDLEQMRNHPRIGKHSTYLTALAIIYLWETWKAHERKGSPASGPWHDFHLRLRKLHPALVRPLPKFSLQGRVRKRRKPEPRPAQAPHALREPGARQKAHLRPKPHPRRTPDAPNKPGARKDARGERRGRPPRKPLPALNPDHEACRLHWPAIKRALPDSPLRYCLVSELAACLKLYWPRRSLDFPLGELVGNAASADKILALRGVGPEKASTLYSVIAEAWRFTRGESDPLEQFLARREAGAAAVKYGLLSATTLVRNHWPRLQQALFDSPLGETTLEEHYRPRGIKCVPSLQGITIRNVIQEDSLRAFLEKRRGIGKQKAADLSLVLQGLWASVEPDGPAGPPPPDPRKQAREILEDLGESDGNAVIAKAIEVAGVSEQIRWIIRERFGLGSKPRRTLDSIGQEIGVTRERIRQLQAIGLRQLWERPVTRTMIRSLEGSDHPDNIERFLKAWSGNAGGSNR